MLDKIRVPASTDDPLAAETSPRVPVASTGVPPSRRGRRRQFALVLLPMVLGGVCGFVLSNGKAEVYEATADVALERGVKDTVFDYGQSSPRSVLVEIRVVQSPPVVAAVEKELGVAPPVSVLALGSGDAFEIRARSSDRFHSAKVADAYATEYIRLRQREAIADVEAAEQEIERKLVELEGEIDAINRRLSEVSAEERVLLEQTVGVRRNTLESERGVFKQQLDQLRVAASLRTGGVKLLRAATPPSSPVEPEPVRDGAVGLALGLLAGVTLVLLFDRLRRE